MVVALRNKVNPIITCGEHSFEREESCMVARGTSKNIIVVFTNFNDTDIKLRAMCTTRYVRILLSSRTYRKLRKQQHQLQCDLWPDSDNSWRARSAVRMHVTFERSTWTPVTCSLCTQWQWSSKAVAKGVYGGYSPQLGQKLKFTPYNLEI